MSEDVGVWIRLTKGFATLVDKSDEQLSNFKWTACYRRSMNGNVRVYAVREWSDACGKHRQFLHHAIIRKDHRFDVDHINGDALDNRRGNLRYAARGQNNANGTKRSGTSSRYRGVSYHRQSGKWCAQICKIHIGLFYDEVDAATAYNFVAFEKYGEFLRPNLP